VLEQVRELDRLKGHSPSEAYTAAVAGIVSQNFARQDGVAHENESQRGLGHRLGQVREVEVGRKIVALGLEAGIERLLIMRGKVSKVRRVLIADTVAHLQLWISVITSMHVALAETLSLQNSSRASQDAQRSESREEVIGQQHDINAGSVVSLAVGGGNYPCEAHFISQGVEASNASFGIANFLELGKAEAA
jgi:hypothetical protein